MTSTSNTTNSASNTTNGIQNIGFEEVEIPMPWGHVSGKWWGCKDKTPILAIHGWQDNAGTFDNLAPILRLNDPAPILCIDLPGHGLSSHLTPGSFYYVFWDGVVLVRRIVKHYKWDKVSSGKWWGPKSIQPMVALHGRQDNAGSFDRMIQMMNRNDIAFLCLDLPGHGFSSHFPKGQYYFVHWDGVIMLRRVARHFQWSKIKILGHSLGGAIGFLYAASFPDEVEALISLDIASPTVKNVNNIVPATRDNIDRFLKYEELTFDSVPCYKYDDMVDIVLDAYKGSITRESAEVLMQRGMQPATEAEKYYFSRDPRLKTSMLGMISMDLTSEYARRIKCAYLNIRASPGLKFDYPEHYQQIMDILKKGAKRFEYHEIPGSHHVHLNEPEKVAPIIVNFLNLQ